MNSQARKNIRQAFPVITFGSPEWEVTQAAADWVQSEQVGPIDKTLADLGLLEIARRCLIAGETLEAVGELGPYGTSAQQRAWAAGRLAAACHAIKFASELLEDRKKLDIRIADLERKLAYARAETRAAARFKDINVPFREPRKHKSVDWDAA